MAIVFKYRNKSNLSYAPGFATPGEDGNEGKQGTSGNTVYFVDYDLDNSYSVQLALQRIENNQILTSVANKSIASRPYKENDLLISKSGKVYKIVLAPVTSAQNYKYDIQYLGSIRDKAIPSISKILIACSPTVSDRASIDGRYQANANLSVFLTVFLEDQDDFDKAYKDILDNYSFSLSIYLNNKKSWTANTPPANMDGKIDPAEDNLYQIINFYKKLEFTNLIPVPVSSTTKYTYTELSQLQNYYANEYNLYDGYSAAPYTTNLDNDILNRLHPSGNDIKCTVQFKGDGENKKALWYNTGIGSPDGTGETIGFDPLGDAYEFPFVDEGNTPTADDVRLTKQQMTDRLFFFNGASDEQKGENDYSSEFLNSFPTGAVGNSLTISNISTAQNQLDHLTGRIVNNTEELPIQTSILQLARKYVGDEYTINPNSGSSRFFDFTTEDEIFNFLCNNKNNKYIITVKNKKTHEIYTVEASAEFEKLQ